MLQNIGTTEVAVIAVIILIFFGAKKLPEFARGLKNAKKEFKSSFADDDNETKSKK